MVIPPSPLLHFLNWLFTKISFINSARGDLATSIRTKQIQERVHRVLAQPSTFYLSFIFCQKKSFYFLPFCHFLGSLHQLTLVSQLFLFFFALHFGHCHRFYTALYIHQWGNPERNNPNKHPKVWTSRCPGSCSLETELEVPLKEAVK